MAVIRWGILGCGDVTEVKSGPGFQKATGSALVAVMRRDGEKARDYAQRHGVPRGYDDADKLINDPEVDAVYIATPPGTHETYAMKVLAARKPCYVEKPMARNASEARRMVEAFKAASIPLFVAYYRRALPRFEMVRQLLATAVLGEITTVTWTYHDHRGGDATTPTPWRFLPEHSGGGLFLDMASHAIDLFDFWFGPLTSTGSIVSNVGRAHAVEDFVIAFFDCSAPGPRVMVDCRFAVGEEDTFLFRGKRGALSVPCFASGPIRLALNDQPLELFDLPNPPHVAQPLIQTVVNDLLGIAKCPSTGESALRTQELMDAALSEYYGGREDGFWNRQWPGSLGR